MKRIALIAAALLTLQPLNVYAEDPRPILTTAYYQGTTTAMGTRARPGVAAVNKDHIGYTAIIYEYTEHGPGAIIGYYECEDTGKGGDSDGDGIGAIQEGKVIDIYQKDLEACRAWMKLTKGKVYVQYIRAEG